MGSQAKKYQTQWATQFYAAAELTRRGYMVSLTFGNAPVADLLVQSPSGTKFTVDVKGQANKSFWLVQRRGPAPDHFFILVYVPTPPTPPRFFVTSSDELMRRREEYADRMRLGGKYRDDLSGINWSTAFAYENAWDALPA